MLRGKKGISGLKKKRGKNIMVKLFTSPEKQKENNFQFTVTVFKYAFRTYTEFEVCDYNKTFLYLCPLQLVQEFISS